MEWTADFFRTCFLSGLGGALYVFVAAVAAGFCQMVKSRRRRWIAAGAVAVGATIFSFLGWACVHRNADLLLSAAKAFPWISFALAMGVGAGVMLRMLRQKSLSDSKTATGLFEIGCLSAAMLAVCLPLIPAGLTVATQTTAMAVVSALIRGALSGILAFFGFLAGARAGEFDRKKAPLLGAVLLILTGVGILMAGLLW